MTQFSEYDDPQVYNAEYGGFAADFDIFCTHNFKGDALDLACGTGRITIELARRGFSLVGLDQSNAMISFAREKSEGLGIKYVEGDIRNFNLNQTFDLITLGGNSFQALLSNEDQQAALTCIKNHLKPGGLFIFNTRNPVRAELKTIPEFQVWHDFEDDQGRLVKVYGRQIYDAQRQIAVYETKRKWPNKTSTTSVELRYTDFPTLKRILDSLGFHIVKVYGRFDRSPFSEGAPHIIMLCGHGS